MNTGRARRVFWLGLLISVLLHLGLLSRDWGIPAWKPADASAPIEARLIAPPPPEAAIPKPKPPPERAPPPPPKALPQDPAPVPPPDPDETAEPAEASLPPVSPPEAASVVESDPAVESEPLAQPEPDPSPVEAAPPLNRLPRRITLEYRARYGPASGQQTLMWVNEGDRYTITSVVSARGLANLIFSGQLVQTSRGRITPQGLQPEEFWDQRGSKRSQSRFDYDAHLIHTDSHKGSHTAALPAGLQDAQSLLFQLALTAPPATDSESAVFNGKKVRNYRYRVAGEETLDTPLGALRTLHLVRQAEGDAERFEIWLAADHGYLPVKLSTEISGYDAELMVESLTSEP